MALYREALPQLGGDLFLTDGGIETSLIFLEGLELPDFAAFHLLRTPEGTAALRRYFEPYVDIAARHGAGFVLESATWRASADWGERLGYSARELADANRKAIDLLLEIRDARGRGAPPMVVSGCVGPRGDGYVADRRMSAAEAEAYHRVQVEGFAADAADMVCALTMNYVEEAVGIARAAKSADMPVAVSFTVETDGRLPTGQTLQDAIDETDDATAAFPAYYMVNCAHPSHFRQVLASGGPWLQRIRGVRANASRKSHAELNDSTELDFGDPVEFGSDYADLGRQLSRFNVMGGCCGTDQRHVAEIAAACAPAFARRPG